MGKFKFILFCIVLIASCKPNNETGFNKNSIEAKVERIIITTKKPTVVFIISFRNNTDKNIVLSGNSLQAFKYENAGVMMKNGDFVTPLGSPIPDGGLLFLNANKSVKFVFVYSQVFSNNWKQLKGSDVQQELADFVMNSKFYYSYNKKIVNENYQKFTYNEDEPKGIRYPFDRGFEISNINTPIEYRDNLSYDEAVKLADGVIIEE